MVTSVTVLDSSGGTQTVNTLPALGSAVMANSLPVTLASDGPMVTATGTVSDTAYTGSGNATHTALLKAIANNAVSTAPSPVVMSLTPKAVAISQTAFVLGATGAAGDTLSGIIIQPTGTTVGSVIVLDGSTAMYTYPGGTVGADLRPIVVPLGAACATAWKVTTPANATVLALGKFT